MSNDSVPIEELATERFFRDFDAADVAKLAPHSRLISYTEGTTIFRASGAADRFYLVRTGRVALFLPSLQEDVIVQTLGPGEALGFSWLAPPHLWRFSATATSDIELIEFDAAALRQAAIVDRQLHDLLMTRMFDVVARRLEATRMQLLDIYSDQRPK